jgi:hypothetical protein
LSVMQRVPRELLQRIQLRMPALDIAMPFEHQSWAIANLGMPRFQFADSAERR